MYQSSAVFHISQESSAVARMSDHQQRNIAIEMGTKLREVEKIMILETLKEHAFNRTRAARSLGIGIRTLQRKIKIYKDAEPHLCFG